MSKKTTNIKHEAKKCMGRRWIPAEIEYFELNNNGNSRNQNYWDAVNAVLEKNL